MPSPGTLNLVADPALEASGPLLEDRLRRWADGLTVPEFQSLMEPLVQKVLAGAFDWLGASEGTVWIAEPKGHHLVAAFNSGPQADELIGFQQPLNQGIISLVYANEQSYCENEVAKGDGHDNTLDDKLGMETAAMLAVPLYFAFGLRGVISCVQLNKAGACESGASGFDTRHVEELANAATLVERLINSRLTMATLGLDHV